MKTRPSRRFVGAYLREIGIDFIPAPPRGAAPAQGPARGGAAAETLDDIRRELGECRGCVLCGGRRTIVFGVGNPRARLMFVGEGPGEEEDRQGEPFVGAAGRRLNQWIGRIGLSRGDVYIANVVKCRPPGNRKPLPAEARACLPYLRRQVRAISPEVICTLGGVALNFLLDNEDKITRARGRWRSYEGIPVMPTYHPAYILRNPGGEAEVFADFDEIARRLGLS